jgi:outer membrane lipoprotein SlyB
MRGRALSLLLCALVLGGCGGDEEAATTTTTGGQAAVVRYERGPTMTCLKSKDYDVSTNAKDVGFVAFTAVGGGLRASKRGGGDVIMAFGADGDDAAQTLKGVAKASPNAKLFRTKLRESNVAILWAYIPTESQKKAVYGCLKSAG